MSLYNKYRPQSFDEIIGNEEAVLTLQSLLSKPDCPHAFLITGETGCGKTTIGRIIARMLGCKGGDYHEIDSSSFRGIDTIREIRQQSNYMPLEGPCQVWLLDEAAKNSNDAQHALLKALEDPPSYVYYILCTTDPQKLLPTIRGRCSEFSVHPLNENQMFQLLRHAVKGEGESLSKSIYEQIAQDSLGHPRNALQILEQVLAVEPEQRLNVAKRSAETQSQVIELCRALMSGSGWKKVSVILSELTNEEPETIRRAVLGYCQSILLKEDNVRAGMVMEQFISPFYDSGWPQVVFAAYSVVKE